MIKTLKKVWRYVRRYKKLFIVSIIMMLIVQLMGFISPLIVKSILDEQLLGIQNTWYQVNESEDAVYFLGNYYKQENKFSEGDTFDKPVTILVYENGYYFYEGVIPEGIYKIDGTTLTVTGDSVESFSVIKLGYQDVIDFYEPTVSMLIILIVLLLIKCIIHIVANFIQKYSTANLNVNVIRDARLDAARSLQKLPISYFENEPAGKVSARIIHDVNGMTNLLNTVMNLLINAGLSLIFAYVGMFILDPSLALLTFVAYPIVYIWLRFFMKLLKKIAWRTSELNSLIVSKLNEIINGITILRLFNNKKQTTEDFDVVNNDYRKEYVKEQALHSTLGWNMIELLRGIVAAVIVVYFGFQELSFGSFVVTAGLIYAYNEYLLKIIDPINLLFRQVSMLEHALVRTERIFKIIDGKFEDSEKKEIPRYRGEIEFEKVSFRYNDKTDYVLKDIDLHINPGEMIGIVGHTGSGKSTMMSLLLRFYDLFDENHGHIYVDGQDIMKQAKRTYRSHIGIILQDPVLFKGTIASNIRFGKKDVSDEYIIETLTKIGGKHIIDKFENGINQDVTRNGSNLSLGEKQLICFARALVYDPAILVMDEATANIDTETEEMISKALDVVSRNRTTIVIAHRLSTIEGADRIFVLDNGYKVEEGNHKELLAKGGVYSRIYFTQVSERPPVLN